MDVKIRFGRDRLSQREQAILLLAEAERQGLDASVVKVSDGLFLAPVEVAQAVEEVESYEDDEGSVSGVHTVKSDPDLDLDEQAQEPEPEPAPEQPPAKKATAKKTAKKAAAKRTPAKKAQE